MATKNTKAAELLNGLGRELQKGVEAAREQRAETDRLRAEAAQAVQLRAENAALRAHVQQLQSAQLALGARPVSAGTHPQVAELQRQLEHAREQIRALQSQPGALDTEFLQQRALEAAIEDVVTNAKDFLLVVSPYVKIADALRVPLQAARNRGVQSVLLCREGHPKDAPTTALVQQLFGQVLRVPSLHAKCYVNQSRAVVASLNLYEFSSQNLEMGVAFSHTNPMHRQVLAAVQNYAGIAQRPDPAQPAKAKRAATTGTPKADESGHCIRCATAIAVNAARPLCASCYRKWAEFANVEYAEKHCHGCGAAKKGITFARPLCRTCYRTPG